MKLDNETKESTARRWLRRTLITAMLMVCLYIVFAVWFVNTHSSIDVENKRLEIYSDFFKTILIGGVIAMASTLVAAVLTEAREQFEKLKESRLAYSKAKTGVDYLPTRFKRFMLGNIKPNFTMN
jgi:hypothetical protein